MSQFQNNRRNRNLYEPGESKPFKLSRSKIDLFLECPLCFYLDRRLGIGRPPGFPFTLNSAVDTLLKKEFDEYRAKGEPHPLITKYGVDARPIPHELLDQWRQNFVGVQYLYEPANFLVTGAIDDLWQNSQGEYIVVDYKATAKNEEITGLNHDWQISYKRQMEIYQWLLRQNKLKVAETGYFVYCNGQVNRAAFDQKLEFEITLIAYPGKTDWVEKTLRDIHACLNSETPPPADPDCDYCNYRKAAAKI